MSAIAELIDVLRKTDDCSVVPACGLPPVGSEKILAPSFRPLYQAQNSLALTGHVLPDDLREFYSLCGGAAIYEHALYPWYVVPPTHCVLANPVLISGWDDEQLRLTLSDRSWSWFVLAQDQRYEPYAAGVWTVTIDLATDRLGRCYDSFWDRHTSPGDCEIVATSFTDFLEQVLAAKGSYCFWTEPLFRRIGDAYAD